MRLFIKNRYGVDLAVQTDEPASNPRGLAFIAHGQAGFIEQPHIQALTEAFLDQGYRAIRWDAANSIGDSGGRIEECTMTSYYEDLEDVVTWAQKQSWFVEPFLLCGHSMGGFICTHYAAQHPHLVRALVPVSTGISGALFRQTCSQSDLINWEQSGFAVRESKSKPGVIVRIPWKFVEDYDTYDLLQEASHLTMPTLLLVGDQDTTTPLAHQQMLFDAVASSDKRLKIIRNADHNFRSEELLAEVKNVVSNWVEALPDSGRCSAQQRIHERGGLEGS